MLNIVDLYMVYELTNPIWQIGFLQRILIKVIPSILLKAISLTLYGVKKKKKISYQITWEQLTNCVNLCNYLFSLDVVKNYNKYSCIKQFQLLIGRLLLAYNAIHSYWFIIVGFGWKRQL